MKTPHTIVRNDAETRIANIHTGVAIILWAVLTDTVVWPIASIVSAMRDRPLLSYSVMVWAVVLAVVVSLVITRFVFPINYDSTPADSSQDSITPGS